MNKLRFIDQIKNRVFKILPHVSMILAIMFIVFLVLDQLNPIMNFVNCRISNKLLWIFCGTSIGTSICEIYLSRK